MRLVTLLLALTACPVYEGPPLRNAPTGILECELATPRRSYSSADDAPQGFVYQFDAIERCIDPEKGVVCYITHQTGETPSCLLME